MKNKTCFIIFSHSVSHNIEDIDDIISNISYFNDNCDFIVNHPTVNHPKVRFRHNPGPLNNSNFIFGALVEIIKNITDEEIKLFDHFCLVSANQYFINNIKFEKNINYVQFLNTDNWDKTYVGKNTDKTIVGFPLQQPYGRWDPKNLFKEYNIKLPMTANWECLTITNDVMSIAKKHIDTCLKYYPNEDMMNVFLPYMVLLSNQKWEYPPHFGTYDPSNRPNFNWIITTDQIIKKHNDGYFSIKRVNYSKDCPLKNFIKQTYMK